MNLRWRPDVPLRRQLYNGQTFWVAKDPLSLKYFRFTQVDHFIVRQLDGKTSLGEMQRRFQDEFAPQLLSLIDLLSFLGQLHQNGLTISDSPGQGDFLWQRRDKAARAKWRQMLSNPFAIRLPAFDPQQMLDGLYPAVRFCFSPWAIAAGIMVMLAALLLVLSRLDEFRSAGAGLAEILGAENWGWLVLAIAGTKLLHEFGHALTARHYRCECHEMGVMLLCFAPTVYTNVTDAWILPNKWSRMAISAAGIYIELLIAAVATFVWWFTAPGTVHHLAMILMLTCSLQTVLANANPLMRFDGYFVLSDWLEIPNLRGKARRLLLSWLSEACLGIEPLPDGYLPGSRRILFTVYSVAAILYGWFVFYLVLAFLLGSYLPREARWVGLLLATMLLWIGCVSPLIRFRNWLIVPGRLQQISLPKLFASVLLAAMLLIAFCTLPTQEKLASPIELQPRRSVPVQVSVAGRIAQHRAAEGRLVTAGEMLAAVVPEDGGPAVEVSAPFAGIVVSPLDTDRNGGRVVRGETLCRIAERDRWEARWQVPERALARLRVGQPATVRIAASPESEYTGTITDISPRLSLDGPVRSHDSVDSMWVAAILLDQAPREGPIGGRGWAKVLVSRRSWGSRAWHAVRDLIAGDPL